MAEPKSVADVAEELAAAHKHEDPETTAVFLAAALDEVRLVEVSGSVGTSGEVLPYRFAAQPAKGIKYPSVVILLSPEEWSQVQDGRLSLPAGWGTPQQLKKIA